MHKTQKQIIKKLLENKRATYTQLKPKNIEGNVFIYHLKSLIKNDYISKNNKIYSLTPKGKHLVDRLSLDNLNERIQPTIVTTIILEDKGKYLLYKRKKQPFFDHICFPYGKIHLEERILEAASRELFEKSGLKADLKYKGHVYLTIHDETELVSNMLCHVFSGKNISGEIRTDYSSGQCFWDKLENFPKIKILPGVTQMAKLLKTKNKEMFFEEYFLNTTDEDDL